MEQLTFDLPADASSPVLCACGCGTPTPISKYSDKRTGVVKGQPTRYAKGHSWNGRIDADGRECTACHERKPWGDFPARRSSIRGHCAVCKSCTQIRRLAPHDAKRRGRTKGRADDRGRECTVCVSYKSWDDYHLSAVGFRGHESICKTCKGARAAEWWRANPAPQPEDWEPPTGGCPDSRGQYAEVIPLQYGIYIYRCWTLSGKCVYVGKTKQVLTRLGAHARMPWWREVHHVDVAVMLDWTEADAEEIRQIRHYRPVNNSAYNRAFARKSAKPQPTHCPQDHEYTPENTIYNAKGSKVCRTCKNEKARAKPKKGIARGERQGAAKLTGALVADMRRRYALGCTISALSREYGVARSTVRKVVNGLAWVHVKGEDSYEPQMSLRL